ncbi:ATP-binding protein [Bradyrhizobium sp. WSM2254]|uniref:ATP-binding protein n=1 Tax=Bradyrhizobium sp. WSM2254 TaxID=1188263 RepID=UPI0006764B28
MWTHSPRRLSSPLSSYFATVAPSTPALAWPRRGERRLNEKLLALTEPKLLIIDELGYLPLESDAAHLFFQLVSRRYETGATLITSNRSVAEWVRAKRKSGLNKPPAADGPPVGSASLRPVSGGANLQPTS